jgi:hypothetical protein
MILFIWIVISVFFGGLEFEKDGPFLSLLKSIVVFVLPVLFLLMFIYNTFEWITTSKS